MVVNSFLFSQLYMPLKPLYSHFVAFFSLFQGFNWCLGNHKEHKSLLENKEKAKGYFID